MNNDKKTVKRKPKLAPAKDWRNRPIDTWNTSTFTAYLTDKHRELFGIDYAPFGGKWQTEQGYIGSLIGTKSPKNPKPRTASNEDVKRFIDECMAKHMPTKDWPGINFGFMWNYRKTEWQRIQAEALREERSREQAESAPSHSDLAGWF